MIWVKAAARDVCLVPAMTLRIPFIRAATDAEELFILSELSADHACPKLASSASGLAAEEAERRLKT